MKLIGAAFTGYGMGIVLTIGSPPAAGILGIFYMLMGLIMLYIAFKKKMED